jgi:hypothetical protein
LWGGGFDVEDDIGGGGDTCGEAMFKSTASPEGIGGGFVEEEVEVHELIFGEGVHVPHNILRVHFVPYSLLPSFMSTEQREHRRYIWQEDKRIYVVKGEGYALPIYVRKAREGLEGGEEGEEVWVAWSATDWSLLAQEALLAWLRARAREEVSGGYFIFGSLGEVEAFAELHYGVTPEYVFDWYGGRIAGGESMYFGGDAEVLEPDLDERFLKLVVDRTGVCSGMAQMKVVWAAIVQTMGHWLLKHRKPLNMGLFTICAVPYRANWKSVLYGGYPHSHQCFAGPENEVEGKMDRMGLTQALLGSELLALHGRGEHWFHWTVEVIPNRMWKVAVQKTQELRFRHAGAASYAQYIAETIRRLRHHITTAYGSYLTGSLLPSGRVSSVGSSDCQIIKPDTPKGGLRRRDLPSHTGDIIFRSGVDWDKPKFGQLLDETLDEVCRLPDVRQEVRKLRLTGGDIPEPGDG